MSSCSAVRSSPVCRSTVVVISALAGVIVPGGRAPLAQGLTTASIQGVVEVQGEGSAEGAQVLVRHMRTGVIARGTVGQGRFTIYGLEVGGPYTVRVQRIGFAPEQRDSLFLHLGEPVDIHVVLRPAPAAFGTVDVVAAAPREAERDGGIATTVADSLVRHLPTLDRNLYDFVHLAPQVSTKTGLSAGGIAMGGMGLRYNNFLVDGVSQRSALGSQPLEFAGGKSLPFEAVSEYQILVAPFDVRYGDFAGGMVNLVTRAGTNEATGSAFISARNDALGRRDPTVSGGEYDRLLYALSFGAPLRRDRAHIFAAAEFQQLRSPAPGPYVGQPVGAIPALPIREADLARLTSAFEGYGLTAGSGGAVNNRNPLTNLFARADVLVSRWNSRAVVSWNEARSENLSFTRAVTGTFPLSTHAFTQTARSRTHALQLHTALGRAQRGHNLFVLARNTTLFGPSVDVRQPIINVRLPGASSGTVTVASGPPPVTHEAGFGPIATSIMTRNDVTLPLGASHVMVIGAEGEWFRVRRAGVPNAYGTWTFSSVDSLAAGIAERFEVARNVGSGNVPMLGAQLGAYFGDRWRAGARLQLMFGVRADLLLTHGQARYNREIDSIFGYRTDAKPRERVHWSPRLGFVWSPDESAAGRVRGGVGVFTGRPPLAWLHVPRYSHGEGIATLACGTLPNDAGPPPTFVSDYRTPPLACANGATITASPRGDVDLLDRDLGMARTLRGALAYDRWLPGEVRASVEALVTHGLADFVFVNHNLAGPQGTDRRGRVLYGTFGPTGAATPQRRSPFPSVTELRAVSGTRAQQYAVRLAHAFAEGHALSAHYTFTRVRDVQTPLRVNTPGHVNWAAHARSGRHDDLRTGISLNDIPHRVVIALATRAPWTRWTTALSFYYVGESGSPFTYVAWGTARRGDLNADGSSLNDPIYVPRTATDTSEIRFQQYTRQLTYPDGSTVSDTVTVQEQARAFDQFVDATPCLRRQRGRIVGRNSCREPWSHQSVLSLRQHVPIASRALEAQLDVYNLLNLLNEHWGRYRIPAPQILEHVAQTTGPAAQPVFRYAGNAPRWTTAFQLQFALRYRF